MSKYQKSDYSNQLEMSNMEIKKQFVTIYDKLQNQNTKEVGYEIYQNLIENCLYNEYQIFYIIQQISDNLTSISAKDKDKESTLKLLSLIFYSGDDNIKNQNILIYNKYISKVLSIFQTLINDNYTSLFQPIANIYAEIVEYVLPTSIESSVNELDVNLKRMFEMLQGFCFYNMNLEQKGNRLVGSLCLIKLVENCPIVLHSNYMKIIWENIMHFLEKQNYNSKTELLNCLISLILGAETDFKPYANVTLYKIIEFLTDNDWVKRKLALNVIYTIVHYCKEEIISLKSNLIEFLKLLKFDKVKEVRDICILILDVLNSNNDNTKGNIPNNINSNTSNKSANNNNISDNNNNAKIKVNTKSAKSENSSNNLKSIQRESKKNTANDSNSNENNLDSYSTNTNHIDVNKSNNISNNNKNDSNNKSITPSLSKKKLDNKGKKIDNRGPKNFILVQKNGDNITSQNIENTSSINNNNYVQKSVERPAKRAITPNRISSKRKNSNNIPSIITNSNDDFDVQNNQLTTMVNKNNNTNENVNLVSRKKDGTFVNEKMVIRHDPNKSAFKNAPNKAFFSKNQNNGDGFILVLDKKKENKNNINSDDNNNQKDEILEEKNNENDEDDLNNNNLLNDNNMNKSSSNNNLLSDNINKNNNNKNEDDSLLNKGNEINQNSNINENSNNFNKNINKINDKVNIESNKNLDEKNSKRSFKSIKNKYKSDNSIKYEENDNLILNKYEKKNSVKESYNSNNSNKNSNKLPYNLSTYDSNKKNKNDNNNNNNLPSNIVNQLLSQMNSLSNKQLSLLSTLESIKNTSSQEINLLNNKINALQNTLSNMRNELNLLKSKQNINNNLLDNNLNDKENEINNINEIFKNSLNDDKKLIDMISKISLDELGDIDLNYLEKALTRLISMLSKGEHMKSIISFYKSIILCLKMPLKKVTIQNILDIFNYILENNDKIYHLDNSDYLDVSILLKTLQDYKNAE